MDSENWVLGGTIAFCVLLVGLFIWGSMVEQQQWNQFASDHHCVVIGHEQGGMGTGFGVNGNVTVIALPDKTTFKCDDGQTYTRAN